jgi:hypothetical protein
MMPSTNYDKWPEILKQQAQATLPEARCSAADGTCGTCHNWEPEVHTKKRGYCPVFNKTTDQSHGQRCTAYMECFDE